MILSWSHINPVHAIISYFSMPDLILSSHLRLGLPVSPFPTYLFTFYRSMSSTKLGSSSKICLSTKFQDSTLSVTMWLSAHKSALRHVSFMVGN
jgi:hypothetical protein